MSDTTVEYFFDPACPWTWLTSRWLIDAARQRGVDVTWRSLSLSVVNAGKIPEQYADFLRASAAAHRVFAALREAGRTDLVGELYTAIGSRARDGGEGLSLDLIREAVEAAGAGDWAGAIDDATWDEAVERSTAEAVDLAGPDVGSPVLAHGTPRVAMFGPIVSPRPRGAEGAKPLDLVLAAAGVGGLFELKRGRRAGPALPAPAY